MIIESPRLKLVSPSMEYQPAIMAAVKASQHELARFLSWVPMALDKQESLKQTEQAIANFTQFHQELRFLMIEKATDQLIGSISLHIRNKAIPYFEIGYWLSTSRVGHGYMTEAVRHLENYAFEQLNARRVEIRAAETNYSSRAVAERCGYEYEGTLKNESLLPDGQLSHTVVYAKIR